MRATPLARRWLLGLTLVGACAGCAPFQIVTMERNYITYQHRFTDAAEAEVLKSAERLCGQRKQLPVRTSHACSLNDCTTSYQCVDPANAGQLR